MQQNRGLLRGEMFCFPPLTSTDYTPRDIKLFFNKLAFSNAGSIYMDIRLKKRIVGFLLLVGIVLIIIPIFFGRSIPVDELKLSANIPPTPAKPSAIHMPIPPQQATTMSTVQTVAPLTGTTSVDSNSPAFGVTQIQQSVNNSEAPTIVSKVIKPTISPLTVQTTAAVATVNPTNADASTPNSQESAKTSVSISAPPISVASQSAMPGVTTAETTSDVSSSVTLPATETAPTSASATGAKAARGNPANKMIPPTVIYSSKNTSGSEKSVTSETKPAILMNGNATGKSAVQTAKKTEKTSDLTNISESVEPVKTTVKNSKPPSLPSNVQAWSVQVGSFYVKQNAEKLMKTLQSKGFSAYLNAAKTSKGELLKVLVGPHLNKSDAAKTQADIQKQFNMKGILTKVSA